MPIKDMLSEPGNKTKRNNRCLKQNENKQSLSDPFVGPEDLSEWKRIPGLFRKWEFALLIEDGDTFSFQRAPRRHCLLRLLICMLYMLQ